MLARINNFIRSVIAMGTTFSIVFLSVICLLLLQVAGAIYPEITQYIDLPALVPTIILVVLTELLFLNIKTDGAKEKVSPTEVPFVSQITDDVKKGKIKEVNILSSGLSSRYLFIADLVREKVKVKIIVQGKKAAGDKADLRRMPSMIDSIDISTEENTNEFLEVRGNASITTLRGIIVHYKNGQKTSILSWYCYDSAGRILGHTNPAIVADDRSHDSQMLTSFLEEKFANQWLAAEEDIVFPKVDV